MAKGFAYFLHIGDPARFPVGRKPTLIICSPARQFPTGAIMPMTRRMELVAFAKRTGAYLLEDNFESEFNYEAPPTSSLFELAPERVLSVGTFSKVLFPSVRLGYIVAYVGGMATMRSAVWALAFAVNVAILFQGWR